MKMGLTGLELVTLPLSRYCERRSKACGGVNERREGLLSATTR